MDMESPGKLDPGTRIYAIGDVHGCDRQLAALHAQVVADLRARPVPRPILIHLGDYVDRGPDSAGVVARLAAGPPMPGLRTINLMGNHEHTMLAAIAGDRAAGTDWLHTGGRESLISWGADPDGPRARWRDAIPYGHLDLLHGLALSHSEGGYLFVHAGIRPGVPLMRQTAQDMLCIRQPFLSDDRPFGFVVVHGHTPQSNPEVRPNRIGIDTGAVYGRALTCVVLEEQRLRFMQA
jgi:serine/threonine protein phosphatase 1